MSGMSAMSAPGWGNCGSSVRDCAKPRHATVLHWGLIITVLAWCLAGGGNHLVKTLVLKVCDFEHSWD